MESSAFHKTKEIFAVPIFGKGIADFFYSGAIQPALVKGYFFEAGNLVALSGFNGFDKLGCGQHAFVCPRIQPGETSAQLPDMQFAPLQIGRVDAGYLQFASRRRFDALSNLDDIVVVEIKAGYGQMAFWFGWLCTLRSR